MKIVTYASAGATQTTYTKIRNLRFAPSIDVINERISVDEFECDYIGNPIFAGYCAELRDDDDDLWFFGYVVYSEEGHIRVQSEVTFLDRKTMPAVMYSNASVDTVIGQIFANTGASVTIDTTATSGLTITGFCKEQSARERLQQVLFVSGLYIKSSFVSHPTVTKLQVGSTRAIPSEITYWKPSRVYQEYITGVKVTAFSFTAGTPTSDDEYVTDGVTKWIVTRNEVTLTNTDVPQTAAPNVVTVDDVMLVTNSNVDDVVSLLASYHFNRLKVDFDIINNGEYENGERCSVRMNADTLDIVEGFIESSNYDFGLQSKSRMTLGSCNLIDASTMARLKVSYVSKSSPVNNLILGTREYVFPKGANYTITNPFLGFAKDNINYVFRPASKTTSGTMPQEDTNISVNCYKALEKDAKTGILTIYSVDNVDREQQGSGSDIYYVAEID